MALLDGGDQTLAERPLFRALYRRALEADLIGATLAFIYLSFVSPRQPEPPHNEQLRYLLVAPVYVLIAAVVGYKLAQREFHPIRAWLGEVRAPTTAERTRILSLPWRTAGLARAGWFAAAVLFGVITATHPATRFWYQGTRGPCCPPARLARLRSAPRYR
jgi:hypothetical protein